MARSIKYCWECKTEVVYYNGAACKKCAEIVAQRFRDAAKEEPTPINVTELERKLLENIAENCYAPLNGAEPEECADANCWSDTLQDGPHTFESNRQISALMSTTVQKGLVSTNGESCQLTEEGFKAYKEGKK